jgi:outer membrane protein assembly factor BamD
MVRRGSMVLLAAVALMLSGCSSGESTKTLTVEERFAHAKELFDRGSYLDASNEFTVITLQYQGSTSAADAQYYLGECRLQREEYLLAAFEYMVVKRNYPASPRVPDALYKLAFAYYKLSPKSSLDQQYTKRALDEFQSFVEYYPSHPMAVDAEARIKELNTRMAKKTYETARLYSIMEYYRAALFYYDDVIEKYHDTEYAPLAYLDKVDLLISRNRYKDASVEVNRFLERFPDSVLRSRMEKFKKEIDDVLKPHSRTQETPVTVPPGASL